MLDLCASVTECDATRTLMPGQVSTGKYQGYIYWGLHASEGVSAGASGKRGPAPSVSQVPACPPFLHLRGQKSATSASSFHLPQQPASFSYLRIQACFSALASHSPLPHRSHRRTQWLRLTLIANRQFKYPGPKVIHDPQNGGVQIIYGNPKLRNYTNTKVSKFVF